MGMELGGLGERSDPRYESVWERGQLPGPSSLSVSHPSPRIRVVYSTRRDRYVWDGAGARGSSFEPAKALIRGLNRYPNCRPSRAV